MMPNLGDAFVIVLSLAGIAGMAALYFAFVIARPWLENANSTIKGKSAGRVRLPGSSLDSHITTEWTQGRLRLDSLLALMRKLRASVEQEAEKQRHLDTSDPLSEREALKKVGITLRGFTFDKHLREECRVLIPLLQFCARDLADTRGIDMTQKLIVLAEIQAAIESVDRD
jgi:hypothetical protein